MKLTTLVEAQPRLPELVRQARDEAIGLTNESGNLVGVQAGASQDDMDELIVAAPAFRHMIAHPRQSLAVGGTVSIADRLAEARAEIAADRPARPAVKRTV